MKIFLHGATSFVYWLSAPKPPDEVDRLGAKVFTDCRPGKKSVRYLEEQFPYLGSPLHVLSPDKIRQPPENTCIHLLSKKPVGKAFCRIENGIYSASPELCFIQLARTLSLHALVKAGNALCGAFYIDPVAGGELYSRRPVTTIRRLDAFVRANPGLSGAKNARTALKWAAEGCASPPEVFLAMVLGLPFRHGGFQVANLKINKRLAISKAAQAISRRSYLVPDIYIPRGDIAIEYDSTTEHAESSQLARDAQKRLALEADGHKVITITGRQLANRSDMRRIAEQIYRHQGGRFRPQSKEFEARQLALFSEGWSFDRYVPRVHATQGSIYVNFERTCLPKDKQGKSAKESNNVRGRN